MPDAVPLPDALLLDVHMPFSYWLERDLDHANPSFRPRVDIVQAYQAALLAEIASLGDDLKGHSIDGVFFSGGYLGLLGADGMRNILRAVRRHFTCADRLSVEGVTFPGSIDLYAASTYLDEGVRTLMFEVPTLSVREAVRLGLPNTLQALDKSLSVLQCYGLDGFGLRLLADVPGRNAGGWEYLLGQVNHYRPMHVEFVPEVGNTLGKPPKGLTDTISRLKIQGYREVTPGFLTRASQVPAFVPSRLKPLGGITRERLGVGLGAETIVDGYWTKNTANLQEYLAKSNDYRSLIKDIIVIK